MDLAWKYQLPVIVLGDRTLNDNAQSFVEEEVPQLPRLAQKDWDGTPMDKDPALVYKRYFVTEDGVSPLAFPGRDGAWSRSTAYTHDEFGVSDRGPGDVGHHAGQVAAQGRVPWRRSSTRCPR